MTFKNREEAGRRLAQTLAAYRGRNPLVLAIPRGAAVMARIIADELDGEMDVVLVRKLRAPGQPELAIGAIDEHGHAYLTGYASPSHVSDAYLEQEKRTQLDVLKRRRASYHRSAADPRARVVIVVDDGIATGSTVMAALKFLRGKKPARLIVAAAVAPPDTVERLQDFADEVVCLATPVDFGAVGRFFEDFREVGDDEVVSLLKATHEHIVPVDAIDPEVSIDAGGVRLRGNLACPADAKGVVVFAHGSGSSRLSPRNRHVADVLNQYGIATLLFDLLTPEEDRDHESRFNMPLLARRLVRVTEWISQRPETRGLPIGYFGASTGAAAAMMAAAELGSKVACIVSRGGRADLAMDAVDRVCSPTMLIVGASDPIVLELNRAVYDALPGVKELSVVRGASHLFEEPGTLDEATRQAAGWFRVHLERPIVIPASHMPAGGKHVITHS